MSPRVFSLRVAALAVPTATVVGGGLALISFGAPHTLIGARVRGGPTGTAAPLTLQVECARRETGVEDRVPIAGLSVEYAGQRAPAECGPDGIAEVTFGHGDGSSRVVVREASGRVLAEGSPSFGADVWSRGTRLRPARLGREALRGRLPDCDVLVDGGGLPLGQPSLVIVALRTGGPGRITSLKAEGEGANVGVIERADDAGRAWRVRASPTFLTASLSMKMTVEGEGAGGDARLPHELAADLRLPVVAGAVGVRALRREGERVRATLFSLAARPRAYARVEDPTGRRSAAVVVLRPDPAGVTTAEIDLAAPPSTSSWLVVSFDPEAESEGAMGWPIDPPLGPAAPARDGRITTDMVWADGLAPMLTTDRGRTARVRLAVAALVAAGALLEVALVIELVRAASRRLRSHVAASMLEGRPPIEEHEPRRLWLAIAALLFGFAVVGLALVAGLP